MLPCTPPLSCACPATGPASANEHAAQRGPRVPAARYPPPMPVWTVLRCTMQVLALVDGERKLLMQGSGASPEGNRCGAPSRAAGAGERAGKCLVGHAELVGFYHLDISNAQLRGAACCCTSRLGRNPLLSQMPSSSGPSWTCWTWIAWRRSASGGRSRPTTSTPHPSCRTWWACVVWHRMLEHAQHSCCSCMDLVGMCGVAQHAGYCRCGCMDLAGVWHSMLARPLVQQHHACCATTGCNRWGTLFRQLVASKPPTLELAGRPVYRQRSNVAHSRLVLPPQDTSKPISLDNLRILASRESVTEPPQVGAGKNTNWRQLPRCAGAHPLSLPCWDLECWASSG